MNRNKQMIRDYLELIPGNYLVQTTRKDCFRITDLIDCEIFTLIIHNGRISCQGQDCIENAKSAYDNNVEILSRINKFENKYYQEVQV